MNDMGALVSIVDDDDSVRESMLCLPKSFGWNARAYDSALGFLASTSFPDTACLIADVQMPCMTGIELYERLMQMGHAIPTILITAYPSDESRAKALADGVLCYLSKPLDDELLIGCVQSALATPGGHAPGP